MLYVRQPKHETCPWKNLKVRGETSAEQERNCLCNSSGSIIGVMPEDKTIDPSDVIQNLYVLSAVNTLMQNSTAIILKY